MPKMISIGSTGSRPNNRKCGLKPVLSWQVELYAKIILLSASCHFDLLVSGSVRNIPNKVAFILSTAPFVCGWYGVVRDLSIPVNLSSSENNRFSNSPPWSCIMRHGKPNRKIKSSKSFFAATDADLLRVAYACEKRVKWSVIKSM